MTAPSPLPFEDLAPPAPDELLVVVGPTASGKTELAVRLAEHFDGEVVGADSVQIYRGFDVGSGKPTPDERRRAPHHLLGALERLPREELLRALRDPTITRRLSAQTRGRVREALDIASQSSRK